MLKKIPFILAIIGILCETANAANNSYVGTFAKRPDSCPYRTHTNSSYSVDECRGDTHRVTYRKYVVRPRDYFITHMCYRPSCNYQAAQYADEKYLIQPLTENANTLLTAINSITFNKLNNSKVNVVGDQGPSIAIPKHPGQINDIVVQDGLQFNVAAEPGSIIAASNGTKAHIQTTPPRYQGPLLPNSNVMAPRTDDMGNIEPGGGTSAIHGLLWSWRVVSNNWEGLWSGATNYAGATPTPADLPKLTNLKNIILISDGADTDGPVNPVNNTRVAVGTTVPIVGGGTVRYNGLPNNNTIPAQEMLQALSANAKSLGGETCDAHNPVESITDQDYQRLCDGLYQQGIRVHVIYLGYSSAAEDRRLGYCANRTRGLLFNNVTTGLAAAFNQIFASIAAQNVRLVEK